MNKTIPCYADFTSACEPKVLVIEETTNPLHQANNVLSELFFSQVSCVSEVYSACNAIALVGFDYVVVQQAEDVQFIIDFLKNTVPSANIEGIILVDNDNQQFLSNPLKNHPKVHRVNVDSVSEKILSIAQNWAMVS